MGRTTILWFLLLLSLSVPSVSSIKTLNSIRELADNNIQFGKTFAGHGLKLLYWLAHNISIDQNDVIDLGYINPSQGHYGFHYFGNRDQQGLYIFPQANNIHYYALGNLNGNIHPGSNTLPSYVTEDFTNTRWDTTHRNDERIIVQSYRYNPRRVRRVYASLHYDPDRTWEISPQLLREIRNIPTLGAFLRQVDYDFNSRNNFYGKIFHCTQSHDLRRRRSLPECDTSEGLALDMKPVYSNANARITWSGIPKTILTSNLFLNVYANMDSSTALESYDVGWQKSGSRDTSVLLHPGLQVRLMKKTGVWPWAQFTQIWAGPEFDEGNRKLPTDVPGYDTSLLLFVKQGKACVRLYIKKSFTDWKNTFKYSWVGFYLTRDIGHSIYVAWQWATKFYENQNKHTDEYLAYEYDFGLDIHRAEQVRFFLEKAPSSVRAQAVPWGQEAVEKIQHNVRGYEARLQPIAIGGKVWARLYIKKSFTDWKDQFEYAWVGFYSSNSALSYSYDTWQSVIKFNRNEDQDTEEYMAYDYNSNMDVRQGMETRFLMTKGYDQEKCRARL
ncbi:uncharacterized protein LOC124486873 [Hypomesus transpacificus]|uniref:uncharacterized protein LOC124486873 n=1 Tax=Hypomesus transpacificus TaxID=137520 RepID=UPI001F074F19|nr:uncharacterized protein LOC124486873 [Hypomesus transpacificus]